MKKKIIISVTAIVLIVAVVASIVLFGDSDKSSGSEVFSVHTEEDIKKFVKNNNIKSYGFDEDTAYINEIELFDGTAAVEFYMTDGNITEIYADFILFENFAEHEDDSDEIEEVAVEELSDSDKKHIEKNFEEIKTAFSEYMGCTFESYDVLATYGKENVEDTDENFYSGNFIKEYSVRDKYGVLWIMRYGAVPEYASVSICKLVDETGYEGFIPAVDLTKK